MEMDKDIEVCHCMGVTLGEIMEAIKNGACDLESLMEATGAGTACGLCRSVEDDPNGEREIHLEDILKEAKQQGLCK
jgi:bacterioferritin-associated ferredoxin